MSCEPRACHSMQTTFIPCYANHAHVIFCKPRTHHFLQTTNIPLLKPSQNTTLCKPQNNTILCKPQNNTRFCKPHKIPCYVNHVQTVICKTTIIPSHRPRQRGMSPVQFECRQDPVVPVWLASRWGPETHLFPMTTWCLRGIHGCTQYPPQ